MVRFGHGLYSNDLQIFTSTNEVPKINTVTWALPMTSKSGMSSLWEKSYNVGISPFLLDRISCLSILLTLQSDSRFCYKIKYFRYFPFWRKKKKSAKLSISWTDQDRSQQPPPWVDGESGKVLHTGKKSVTVMSYKNAGTWYAVLSKLKHFVIFIFHTFLYS